VSDNLFEFIRVCFYIFFAPIGVAICYILKEVLNCSDLVSLLLTLAVIECVVVLLELSKERRDQKWREGTQYGSG